MSLSYRLIALCVALSTLSLLSFAHAKDLRAPRPSAAKTQKKVPIILTQDQKQWLRTNGPRLKEMPPDLARATLRNESHILIPGEASLDYFISLAILLNQSDNRHDMLNRLRTVLNSLHMQKQALQRQLVELENQLARATDPSKRTELEEKIREVQEQIARLQERKDEIEQQIRNLE